VFFENLAKAVFSSLNVDELDLTARFRLKVVTIRRGPMLFRPDQRLLIASAW
jgi:hypothetical protein